LGKLFLFIGGVVFGAMAAFGGVIYRARWIWQ
jgi:hypothetical protein